MGRKKVDYAKRDSASSPRFCLQCKNQLVRKVYSNGVTECDKTFNNRKFCGRECSWVYEKGRERPKKDYKETPGKKRCGKCGELKLLSEYSPCKRGRHGVYNYCRECQRNYWFEREPNRKEIDERVARREGLKKLGLKTCGSCKTVKPLEAFYADPRHSDGKQSTCKECWAQKSDARRLMKEYGMTVGDFISLLDAQDGVCAICGRAPKNNKFNIDHCHKTHLVRALLCVNCNTNLLPFVENFPEWVKKAFDYLENPPALRVIGERMVPETNQSRRRDAERAAKKSAAKASK